MKETLSDKFVRHYWNKDSIKDVKEFIKEKRISPEDLHIWYLEATKKLNPESFNPKAQIPYSELTEEQKFIDKYIANKINKKSDKLAGEKLIHSSDGKDDHGIHPQDKDPEDTTNRNESGSDICKNCKKKNSEHRFGWCNFKRGNGKKFEGEK